MNKALAGLFIGLGFLVPALASAHSAPNSSKDRTPPSVTSVHIASSNTNPSQAKAGDTVTITFTTSEKVVPVVLAETKTLFVKPLNTTGNNWEASYVVNAKDHTGSVDYVLAMVDMAKNPYACSSARIRFVKYCPTTDGSSVTVYEDTVPPPPPADTEAPVIEAHADVYATTTTTSAAVSYTLPTATDNVDASVTVTCTPASGSVFSLGTTTVTCSAEDAAGNDTASTFAVVVVQEEAPPTEPQLYTMKSQPDVSYLCGVVIDSWRYCDAPSTFSFTDAVGEGVKTIDLGAGSSMGNGTIETVTIAGQMATFLPWLITISCFTDSNYTSACSDWASISDSANDSSDGKYWTADFSPLNRTFNPAYYYQMTIYDTEWDKPAYGSKALQEPYWEIVGLH